MTESDLHVWAKTVWAEARGEPFSGQVGVAYVIKNRSLRPNRFGHSIRAVCLAPKQFSCWNRGDPNLPLIATVDFTDQRYVQAFGIVCLVASAGIHDPTYGADHYHSVNMDPYPEWAKSMKSTVTIYRHIFYKE